MSKLTAAKMAEVKAEFAKMDANGDGQITRDELYTLFKAQIVEAGDDATKYSAELEAAIDGIIATMDADKDGKVSIEEFVKSAEDE